MTDSSDEKDFSLAAGFDTPPTDILGREECALDVVALRALLEQMASDPASEACEPDTDEPLGRLGDSFADDDVLRVYGDVNTDGGAACETLVVAFSGVSPGVAGVSRHEFVGVCGRSAGEVGGGAVAMLFIRDPSQSWYLRSGSEAGDDGAFTAVLQIVRREIALLCPKRIVTIGASMGGYAAVRAALMLGATAALAFGPQIFISPVERTALGLPHMFFDDTLHVLRPLCDAAGVQMESLTSIAPRCRTGQPQPLVLELHLGGDCSGDVKEAALLREALCPHASPRAAATHSTGGQGAAPVGCPEGGAARTRRVDVQVVVHAGLGHALAAGLRAANGLEPMLARMLALECG